MRTNARQRIDKERAAQSLRFGEDSACEEGLIGQRHDRRGDPRRKQLPQSQDKLRDGQKHIRPTHQPCGKPANAPACRLADGHADQHRRQQQANRD